MSSTELTLDPGQIEVFESPVDRFKVEEGHATASFKEGDVTRTRSSAAPGHIDVGDVEGPIELRCKGSTRVTVLAKAVRGDSGGSGGSFESRTRDELRKLAADRGIEGRSKMSKDELVAALRKGR